MFNISIGEVDKIAHSIKNMASRNDQLLRTMNLAVRIMTFAGAIIACVGGVIGAVAAIYAGGTFFGAVTMPFLVGAAVFFACREINVFTRNVEDYWFTEGGEVQKLLHKFGKIVLGNEKAQNTRWQLLTLDTYLLQHLPALV